MSDDPRRVLICDDHPMVRQSLGATVRRLWPDAELLEAGDYRAAWTLAERAPDLMLVDLGMPGAEPVDGVRELLARAPATRLLVVTGSDEDATAAELAAVGAAGLVRKTATSAVIEAAVALVARGGRYLPAHVLAMPPARQPASSAPPRPGVALTDRQREVLRLMAEGQSNKAIARALSIAPDTVKTHVSQIFAELGAVNRADACVKAQSLGLL
jgi:DNA-binding NarL/FixJ family response regulator